MRSGSSDARAAARRGRRARRVAGWQGGLTVDREEEHELRWAVGGRRRASERARAARTDAAMIEDGPSGGWRWRWRWRRRGGGAGRGERRAARGSGPGRSRNRRRVAPRRRPEGGWMSGREARALSSYGSNPSNNCRDYPARRVELSGWLPWAESGDKAVEPRTTMGTVLTKRSESPMVRVGSRGDPAVFSTKRSR